MRLSIILACLLVATPAIAQETRIVPTSQEQITLSYAPIVKKTAPAVVNIYTKRKVQVRDNVSSLMNDPFFRQFFGGNIPFEGKTRERVVGSLGSGVIIDPDGTIVTSNHVIKDADQVTVALPDRREFEAKIFKADPGTDLAFLKIDTKEKLPFVDMRDSDTLEVGDIVLALGNPFGVGQTVTQGIISALARATSTATDYQFFIQTDAAINPGNSGGALIDNNGKLIGINTAIYSTSGASIGIGFAIPSNMVRAVLASDFKEGRVVRPWLGISVQRVTPDIADSLGMKTPRGVIVRDITKESPAEKAGLLEGDVILSINGNDVNDENALQYRIGTAKVGATEELLISRKGNTMPLSVVLDAMPTAKIDAITLKGSHPLSGLTVATLTPAILQDLKVQGVPDHGVIVLASSPALTLGSALQQGDIILQVNNKNITSAAQLQKLLEASRDNWQINFQRGQSILQLSIRR